MRGVVKKAATGSTPGLILADNAALYRFTSADLFGGEPDVGRDVLFDVASGRARNIHVVATIDEAARVRRRDWIAFYLSPRGRISRKDYWLRGVLIVFLAEILAALLFYGSEVPLVPALLSPVFGWAGAALAFKRLQDRGYSGWWSLLPYALVLAAAALVLTGAVGLPGTSLASALMRAGFVVGLAALLSTLWAYLWVPIGRGQQGYNRFGPDPLRSAA